jgi:hypothetical protein
VRPIDDPDEVQSTGSKIKGDITQLSDTERAAVDDAVAVARRHRSARSPVGLGIPAFRTPPPPPRTESIA